VLQFLPGPKYVLLGYESRTVLVVLPPPFGDTFPDSFGGVRIYTSAMLDYM
jgi:hypothetical protein